MSRSQRSRQEACKVCTGTVAVAQGLCRVRLQGRIRGVSEDSGCCAGREAGSVALIR